jgi:formiminoglutamate deiminase
LLDTLYLSSSVDAGPLDDIQRRFGDAGPEAWAERVATLSTAPHARIGSAIHSVRAVPAHHFPGLIVRGPLHVHLSEQRAENEQTRAVHGCTPTELLDRYGLLRDGTTAVHATHLTAGDVKTLGRTGTGTCFCPTTERDLADGIGPARDLADAGAPLSLGSDSHAVLDMFEEMRGLEMDDRLASEQRGRFTTAELIGAATRHDALGWDDAGAIAPGKRADLVAVRLDGVRTAGMPPGGAIYAATASDVSHVIVDGRTIVADGRHVSIDVARELETTIRAVTEA